MDLGETSATLWASTGVSPNLPTKFDPSVKLNAPGTPYYPAGPLQFPGWAFDLDAEGKPASGWAEYGGPYVCHQLATIYSEFSGAAGPDVTPPSFSLAVAPNLPGVVLPWDSVALFASEGVDPTSWLAASSATIAGVPATLEPTKVLGTSETNELVLPPSAWGSRSGTTAQLVTADGVTDASGNVGVGVSGTIAFADVGPSASALIFDGTAKPVLLGFQQRAAGDPACEPGAGCVAAHFGAASAVALAARLSVVSEKVVRIRLGVAGIPKGAGGAGPEGSNGIPLHVRVISGDGTHYDQDLLIPPSGWTDQEVSLPPGAGEIGVQLVVPENWTPPGWACPPSAAKFDLAVSRVSVN